MKLNYKLLLSAVGFSALVTGCEKIKQAEPLADKGQKIISVKDYGGVIDNFGSAALVYSSSSTSETLGLQLVFSTDKVAETDIQVTMGVDPNLVTTYNNTQTDPLKKYNLLNSSAYSFPDQTVLIKAGQYLSEMFYIQFNPSLIDVTKNYMVPVTIKAIKGAPAGVVKAPSTGTAYLHFIGNPLAGDYQDLGMRYNYTGTTTWTGPVASLGLATAPAVPAVGAPAGYTATTTYNSSTPTSFIPVDAFTVYGVMGNVPDPAGGAALYFLTANSTYSAVTYDFSSTFNSGYSNIVKYVRGYVAPTPTQKPAFRLITWYNNTTGGAGNDRIIDESFTHL